MPFSFKKNFSHHIPKEWNFPDPTIFWLMVVRNSSHTAPINWKIFFNTASTVWRFIYRKKKFFFRFVCLLVFVPYIHCTNLPHSKLLNTQLKTVASKKKRSNILFKNEKKKKKMISSFLTCMLTSDERGTLAMIVWIHP